jgi:hypothetical protein
MNKLLPILLVVVLSGCASMSYQKDLLVLSFKNENMSGRSLLCKTTASLGFLPNKQYIGKIFGFEFISGAKVNVYAYNEDNNKYNYFKETHAYLTGIDNQLTIVMGKEDRKRINHIIGIERETLEARIVRVRYKDSSDKPEPMVDSDIKKYGVCERNDDLNMKQYFDSLIQKELDIRNNKNKI